MTHWHYVSVSLVVLCVAMGGKPSAEFVFGWLWLCQVQVGSGCRCLDINATMMKANTLTD